MKFIVEVRPPMPEDLAAVAERLAEAFHISPAKANGLLRRGPGPVTKPVSEREAGVVAGIFQGAGLNVVTISLTDGALSDGESAGTSSVAGSEGANEPPDVAGAELHGGVGAVPEVDDPDVADAGRGDAGSWQVGPRDDAGVDHVDSVDLGDAGLGEPDVDQPDVGEPGVGEPGVGEPGVGEPGVGEPGVDEPDVDEHALAEAGWSDDGGRDASIVDRESGHADANVAESGDVIVDGMDEDAAEVVVDMDGPVGEAADPGGLEVGGFEIGRSGRARFDQALGGDSAPDAPATDEALADDAVDHDAVLHGPRHDELRHDEPLPDEPVRREPRFHEPLPDEPVPDEPVPDEPVPDEPVPDEPLRDDGLEDDVSDETESSDGGLPEIAKDVEGAASAAPSTEGRTELGLDAIVGDGTGADTQPSTAALDAAADDTVRSAADDATGSAMAAGAIAGAASAAARTEESSLSGDTSMADSRSTTASGSSARYRSGTPEMQRHGGTTEAELGVHARGASKREPTRTGVRRRIAAVGILPALFTLVVMLVAAALTILPVLRHQQAEAATRTALSYAGSVEGLVAGLPFGAPIVSAVLTDVAERSQARLSDRGVAFMVITDETGVPVAGWSGEQVGVTGLAPDVGRLVADLSASAVANPEGTAAEVPSFGQSLGASWRSVLTILGVGDAGREVASAAIRDENTVVGSVVVGMERAPLLSDAGRALLTTLLLGAIPVLIAIMAAMALARRVTGGLRYLLDAADRISRGDLEHAVQLDSKDELGQLARAIERMRVSLQEGLERLRRRR